MVQIDSRGTARRLFEHFEKFSKITEFEFQNSGPSFFASLSPVCCKKNFDSIRTKLTEEIHFEVFPDGDSSNGTVAAARRESAAPACSSKQQRQHRRAAIEARRAFRTGGIRTCWRSELGAQSGRKNQPACLFVCQCVCLSVRTITSERLNV